MIFSLFKRKSPKLPRNYQNLISRDALEIISILQKAGHETYLVGGCVRDILLSRPSKDFDIATSAAPEEVKRLLQRSQIIGRRFKIVVARRRARANKDLSKELFPVFHDRPPLEEYQITTFRGKPVWDETLHKMDENIYGSAKEDAYRRDFTVNALFLDPITSKVVDYVGGNKDIQSKTLRVIGDPRERFREDPIRILRALRFAQRNGLKIEAVAFNALKEQLPYIREAKKERIREEFLKIWREGVASETFEEMFSLGIWNQLSPLFSRHLESNNHEKKKLLKIAKAVSQEAWRHPRNSAPFFFFMSSDLFLGISKSGKSQVTELLEKLNISKKEADDIRRIREELWRLSQEKIKKEKIFRKHLHTYEQLVQSFYVMKILSDIGEKPYIKLWNRWESDWIKYKNDCVKLFGRPGRASSGRRPRHRRRRGPPPTTGT